MISAYFFTFSELIFLSQHSLAMKISALSTNLFGIMMQVTESKYSVPVLRYDLYSDRV